MPAPAAAPAVPETGVDAEMRAVLQENLILRRGVVLNIQGSQVKCVIKEIRGGIVIASNHEYAKILVRIDRIDAIEGG